MYLFFNQFFCQNINGIDFRYHITPTEKKNETNFLLKK